MNDKPTVDDIIKQLLSNAPDWLLRKKLSALLGGAYSVKYLANLDSEGKGIKPRLRIGGRVAYPKSAVITWLKQQCTIEEGEE